MNLVDQTSTHGEYSLTTGRKVGQSLLAGVILFGSGFFLKAAVNPIGRDFALVIGGPSLILGLSLIVQVWTSRVVLDGDRIEVRSAFCTRSTTRTEIEGLRKVENQYGSWTRIYRKNNLGGFSVSDSFTGGDAVRDWFKGLPDLDQRDADEITKGVSQNLPPRQDLSDTNSFGTAKAWAIGLSLLAGVASIPVMFVSYAPIYEASLIVLLACPIAGILVLRRFPLLFGVFKSKPDPRADLGFFLIWPGIGVVYSYQNSTDPSHLVDSFQLIWWVLAVLLCYLAALLPLVWKRPARWAVVFFLIITGTMYSMGLTNSFNTLPDRSAPHFYETVVLKKSESPSSKGTRYYLGVAPWGPISYSDDVDVPMGTYNKTLVGDHVCYGLHSGVLNGPWYSSVNCGAQSSPRTP